MVNPSGASRKPGGCATRFWAASASALVEYAPINLESSSPSGNSFACQSRNTVMCVELSASRYMSPELIPDHRSPADRHETAAGLSHLRFARSFNAVLVRWRTRDTAGEQTNQKHIVDDVDNDSAYDPSKTTAKTALGRTDLVPEMHR